MDLLVEELRALIQKLTPASKGTLQGKDDAIKFEEKQKDERLSERNFRIATDLHERVPLYFDFGHDGPVAVKQIRAAQKVVEQPKQQDQADAAADRLCQEAAAPSVIAGKLQLTKKQKLPQTAGAGWFEMPQTEITPEVERELRMIQLRNVLDPKRFYKKDAQLLSSMTTTTTRQQDGKSKKKRMGTFQIGTVLGGTGVDTAASLVAPKRNKTGIVDALLADEKSRDYYKRKFTQVQTRGVQDKSSGYLAVKKRRRGSEFASSGTGGKKRK